MFVKYRRLKIRDPENFLGDESKYMLVMCGTAFFFPEDQADKAWYPVGDLKYVQDGDHYYPSRLVGPSWSMLQYEYDPDYIIEEKVEEIPDKK